MNYNETVIGKWADGKTLYRRIVNLGAGPNNSTKEVPHGIVGMTKIIHQYGASTETGGPQRTFPVVISSVSNAVIATASVLSAASPTVTWKTSYNASPEAGHLVIEYVKS